MPRSARLIIFGLIISLFIIPKTTLADDPPSDNGVPVDTSNYKAPQNANYTLENLEHGVLCELAGMSPIGTCIGQANDGSGKTITYLYKQVPGGGAVGGLSNVMIAMYANPPASAGEYLASVGRGLGLVQPAYAQNNTSVSGSGESLIHPILILWEFARNIAYLAFIIIFVVVGLMIMLRRKINPQTVISVQAALPGLIMGLILVTFSYFLASLIIDLSFVGTQVVAAVFVQAGHNVFDPQKLATDSNVFHLFTDSFRFGQNFSDIQGGVNQLLPTIFGSGNSTFALPAVILTVIGGVLGSFLIPGVGTVAGIGLGAGIGGLAGFNLSSVVGLIVPLILIVALIIQFFRLLFKLINAYISLLVNTVVGPLIILSSGLPGQGKALGNWFRNLIANSLIFPAVFATFLFAGFILGGSDPNDWKASPVLFGGLSTQFIRVILAYGIILGTPAVPELVKNALGAKDIQGFDKEAGIGFSRGVATATEIPAGGYQTLWRGHAKPGDPGQGPLAVRYRRWKTSLPFLP